MKKHKKILNELFVLAIDNDVNSYRSRHAAALLYKNNVISYGVNENKTHPFQAQYGRNEECLFWHAETRAIHNALRSNSKEVIKNSSIYVSRAKMKNDAGNPYVLGLSKPCEGCMKAIKEFGIKNIFYTNDCEEPNTFSYTHEVIE